MSLVFYSGLSKDLSLILSDADDFDAIIQVGENQNMKEFHAHSVILRARSPYFRSALSTRWITRKNNMVLPFFMDTELKRFKPTNIFQKLQLPHGLGQIGCITRLQGLLAVSLFSKGSQ